MNSCDASATQSFLTTRERWRALSSHCLPWKGLASSSEVYEASLMHFCYLWKQALPQTA